MTKNIFQTVTFIGAGLIGSSLSRAMKSKGLAKHIRIYTRSLQTLEIAEECGIGTIYYKSLENAIRGTDCIILAIPMGSYRSVMQQIQPFLQSGMIVTDVGSVKECLKTTVLPFLPDAADLVPAHPLAGTEFSGPRAGRDDLFKNHRCIITPFEETSVRALEKITLLWESVGATVEILSCEDHDKILSLTSHLPHLMAYTMIGMILSFENQESMGVLPYAASGFRDFTRIAASDPIMWRDIFLQNKSSLLWVLDHYLKDLASLKAMLEREDSQGLEDFLTKVANLRRQLF